MLREVYWLTADFPAAEKFNLESQIKRSVVSIACNIAEGAGRGSKNEFKHFLSIAIGSSYELETQLILSGRLNFSSKDRIDLMLVKLDEIQKMLIALQKSLT